MAFEGNMTLYTLILCLILYKAMASRFNLLKSLPIRCTFHHIIFIVGWKIIVATIMLFVHGRVKVSLEMNISPTTALCLLKDGSRFQNFNTSTHTCLHNYISQDKKQLLLESKIWMWQYLDMLCANVVHMRVLKLVDKITLYNSWDTKLPTIIYKYFLYVTPFPFVGGNIWKTCKAATITISAMKYHLL